MTSPRTGNPVANQFVISTEDETIFQSYSTIIAKKTRDGVILDESALDYSKTTSKYLYSFLNMNRKDIQNRIESKTYKVEDLNNFNY